MSAAKNNKDVAKVIKQVVVDVANEATNATGVTLAGYAAFFVGLPRENSVINASNTGSSIRSVNHGDK